MLSLLLLIAAAASGAEPVNPFEEPDESELFRLDEQLVTVASRYAQTARKAPSIVTVVTAEDIRKRGFRNVADLLRSLPGIYVWRSTEGRDLASFRGVISPDNNKILILVDGQPWYDGVYTHGSIDDYIPLSHVAQVEVIKGPGSAIYGTNAFAGVVNIVTFDADQLNGARVRWMAGATGRSDVTAIGGGRTVVAGVPVKATAYARMLTQIGDGLDMVPRGRQDIRGHDPRKAINVGASVKIEGLQIQIHHVDHQQTYLSQEANDPMDILSKSLDTFGLDAHGTFMDARWSLEPNDGLTLTPYAWLQDHDNPSNYFYDTGIRVQEVAPGTFEATNGIVTVETEKHTRRWGAGLDLQARPGIDHVLVAGIGAETVRVLSLYDAAIPYGSNTAEVTGFAALDACGQPVGFAGNKKDCRDPRLANLFGYAQYTWTVLPSVEITSGARVDKRIPLNKGEQGDDGAFALSVSPRLGVLLVPTDSVTTKLLYGRAFRAPAVREILVRSELQEDGTYEFSSGNLELLPESIHTVEGEITAQVARDLSIRIDGSYSRLLDEIDKITPPNQYCNLPGTLNIVGAEFGLDAKPGALRLGAAYALTLARYGGDSRIDPEACPGAQGSAQTYSGRRQYEFPPHMVKADVGYAFTDRLSATLLTEAYSKRPRTEWAAPGIEDGKPFALLHFAGRLGNLGRNQRAAVGLSVRNLLDTQWSTGMYRDDAAEPDGDGARYPLPMEGEGRKVLAWVEIEF